MQTRIDEKWDAKWQKYMDYMAQNKRRPSKYRGEDKPLVNWLKHNRKLQNKGLFPERRKEKFEKLLATAESYRRVNQYNYASNESDSQDEEG